MAKSLVDSLIDHIFDEKWLGQHGERLTERELKFVKLFGRKGKILRNVYIPKSGGGTSEIDLLYITQKGIFVLESKNYSGWIYGDEKGTYWTAVLPNKQRNRFYNPVMQNNTHMKWLRRYIGEDIPLFSIIVFSERCELKKVELHSENVKVIKRDRLYATVRNLWQASENVLDDQTVGMLYEKLKERTNVDEELKQAHVAQVRRETDQRA